MVDGGAKSPLVYSELAALHIEARTDHYPYPPNPSDDQAMALARRAVQLDPTSPYAHRAVGFVYSRMGNRAESIRWMRKAYELNTYDLSMAASYGYALVFSATIARAPRSCSAPWMLRARIRPGGTTACFSPNSCWTTWTRLHAPADALLMPKKSHYLAARLIVAQSQRRPRSASVRLPPNWSAPIRGLLPDPCAAFKSGQLSRGD